MKWLIASDIHGSAYWCEKLLEAYKRENAERLLLLGDVLYHGPRNDLPQEYDPKQVIAMLNAMEEEILITSRVADALLENEADILAANALDLEAAKGTVSDVMLDRLLLTSARIAGMAQGIREVAALPDPVGPVLEEHTRSDGLNIQKVAVPQECSREISVVQLRSPHSAAIEDRSVEAAPAHCGGGHVTPNKPGTRKVTIAEAAIGQIQMHQQRIPKDAMIKHHVWQCHIVELTQGEVCLLTALAIQPEGMVCVYDCNFFPCQFLPFLRPILIDCFLCQCYGDGIRAIIHKCSFLAFCQQTDYQFFCCILHHSKPLLNILSGNCNHRLLTLFQGFPYVLIHYRVDSTQESSLGIRGI